MKLPNPFRGKVISRPIGRVQAAWDTIIGKWPSRWDSAREVFDNPRDMDRLAAFYNPIVRACITEIGESLSQATIEIGTYSEDGTWETINKQLPLELLKYPNDFMSKQDLIKVFSERLELMGRSGIIKVRQKSGNQISELWPIPSQWIVPLFAREGTQIILGYKIKHQKKVLPVEDMLYALYFNPEEVYQYFAPYDSAHTDRVLDNMRTQYMAEMLKNMKVPGLTLIRKQSFTSDLAREAAKESIANAIGQDKRGSTLLLDGDISVVQGTPLKDLDWEGFAGSIETRICQSFGVPGIIVGSRIGMKRSTYANYAEARRSFYTETIIPKWKKLEAAFTRSLLWQEGYDRSIYFRFKIEDLDVFQEDIHNEETRILAQYRAGLLTRRKAQLLLGIDPDDPDNTIEQIQQEKQETPNKQQEEEGTDT